MPLSLPSMNAAIVCDGMELETYNVKQEGTSSLTAFIASEAGKNQSSHDSAIQNHVLEQSDRPWALYPRVHRRTISP
ncbi:hypothetical protein EDB89DRAFT_1933266, partial [Lactarius sanguifluus]